MSGKIGSTRWSRGWFLFSGDERQAESDSPPGFCRTEEDFLFLGGKAEHKRRPLFSRKECVSQSSPLYPPPSGGGDFRPRRRRAAVPLPGSLRRPLCPPPSAPSLPRAASRTSAAPLRRLNPHTRTESKNFLSGGVSYAWRRWPQRGRRTRRQRSGKTPRVRRCRANPAAKLPARKGGRKETVAQNAPGGTNVCKRTNHMVTPTGTVSAALRFGLPPAVRMFRTHAQAGLFCGFQSFLRLRRVASWYGLQKALPPKRV